MNRWRTRTAAVLLTAPLALTAACSDSGDVDVESPGVDVSPGELDVEAPDVDAPDVDAPDVDVDADVEQSEDPDDEAGSGG